MAFTKECEYKVEILPNKVLQVRRSDIVKEDGVVVGTKFHRHVVVPGDDVTDECDCVQKVAAVLHTEDVVTAYQATVTEDDL